MANIGDTSNTQRDDHTANLAEGLMSLPPLGLKLHISNSFINLIETKLQNLCTETNLKKASNADILLLKIGTWERVAQNKEDLVAKCYFGRRKLIWEILEKGLKRKIQMHWEHILAIRAQIDENRPGILEIELSQQPLFFREKEPQPRMHTLWDNASDFTGGQAMICRRHLLQFPPGALNKLYDKLLQCDPRFFQMSQSPFPSLQSPYFDSGFRAITFSLTPQNYYYQNGFMGQEFQMICNESNDYSPNSVMDVPLGERVSMEDQSIWNMGLWGQHFENDKELMEQRTGMSRDQFSIALAMNQKYEDELVLNDQLPTMITGNNESEFMNYSGFENIEFSHELLIPGLEKRNEYSHMMMPQANSDLFGNLNFNFGHQPNQESQPCLDSNVNEDSDSNLSFFTTNPCMENIDWIENFHFHFQSPHVENAVVSTSTEDFNPSSSSNPTPRQTTKLQIFPQTTHNNNPFDELGFCGGTIISSNNSYLFNP